MKRFVVLSLLVAGCKLYSGGDDGAADAGICAANGTASGGGGTRNPETGICLYEGTCSPGCLCAEGDTDGVDQIAGGECNGPCNSLDEGSCIASDQCHAAYLANDLADPNGGDAGGATFWGCWDITPLAIDAAGPCDSLDAFACFGHPTCTSTYSQDPSSGTEFAYCSDETAPPPACGDAACPQGSHCEPQCPPCNSLGCESDCPVACVPDAGECYASVTCDIVAPQCPTGTLAGVADGCYTGFCIPLAHCEAAPCNVLTTEGACTARADCEPVYAGMNCTCDANGCTCQNEMFSSCEAVTYESATGS